ncbi:MAG: HNH endonuclease [Chthoniobacterales bacterium]
MRWRQPQAERVQPAGVYSDWKQEIADACHGHCVYCAIHESSYGGLDNFHIDHYRPKSIFADLVDAVANLYLACAICNRFKSNDWPNEPAPDHSVAAYPDPGIQDYNDLFTEDADTFLLSGRNVAARYVVERLYLNRPQLILERRLFAAEERLTEINAWIRRTIDTLRKTPPDEQTTRAMFDVVKSMADLSDSGIGVRRARPYELIAVRRQR